MLSSRSSLRLLLLFICFTVLAVSPANSQVSDPVVAAQAPIPGSGHHYIGIGAETVNPADGSLSFNLPLQTPAGRQIYMPFGITYSGSDQFHPEGITSYYNGGFRVNWQSNITWQDQPYPPYQAGGWSYLLPTYTARTAQQQEELGQPPPIPGKHAPLLRFHGELPLSRV